MTAYELFEMVRAAGGRLTLEADRIDIFCVPMVTARVKAELAVDANGYGNLRAILEEHSSVVSAAEAILQPAKKKKPCACASCVLAALSAYKNRRGTATPSMAMLCRDLGLPASEFPKVRAGLASLEAGGVITITRRANTSNLYTFIEQAEPPKSDKPKSRIRQVDRTGVNGHASC
jgi:hypothetical protein